MSKRHRTRRKPRISKAGQRPGSLIYTGQYKDESIKVDWFHYDPETCKETVIAQIDKLPEYTSIIERNNWLNVSGLDKEEWIKAIGTSYKIHTLSLEDALNVNHPPKVDIFDHYIFVTLKMIMPDNESWSEEHISFTLQENLVISFQEHEADVFNPIRERLKSGIGRLRNKKADYLLYALLDVIIDNYFSVTHKLTDQLYQLQEELILDKNVTDQEKITQLHNEWIRLRQIILPFRTAFNQLVIAEDTSITDPTLHYFKDLKDHLQQLTNELQMQQDLINSVVNQNMTNLSYNTNEVMRKLTVIATIFIPLTFIAGVYGMNFDNMPELHWEYGYLFAWAVMIITAILMYTYLKKIN